MQPTRTLVCVVAVCACCVIGSAESIDGGLSPSAETRADETLALQNLGEMPLAFTKNEGQWDERVLFRADAGGAVMWYTTDGVYYQFTRHIAREAITGEESDPMDPFLGRFPHDRFDYERDSIETLCVKASFVGANPVPEVTGVEVMEYKCNYFLGNDPAQWRTDVPNYQAVVFRDLYEGIDLKYYGTGDGRMEYDFVVSPGADIGQIRVRYEGEASLSVDEQGRLVVSTPWTDVIENRPYVFQERNGIQEEIGGEYVLLEEGVFGFALDEYYDPSLPVVIDPVLSYSTYLGGSYWEYFNDIAIDGSGSAYVAGETVSTDFPTANPFQAVNAGPEGWSDAFVTKLSASGSALGDRPAPPRRWRRGCLRRNRGRRERQRVCDWSYWLRRLPDRESIAGGGHGWLRHQTERVGECAGVQHTMGIWLRDCRRWKRLRVCDGVYFVHRLPDCESVSG